MYRVPNFLNLAVMWTPPACSHPPNAQVPEVVPTSNAGSDSDEVELLSIANV